MARFSIFGASGFIGSHLTANLKRAGHDVTPISRDDLPSAGQSLGYAIYCIGLTADFRRRLADTVRAHVCMLADILASYSFDSFLYLSSARIYAGVQETREEAALLVRPELSDHIYNLSKLTGEALCLARPEPSVRVARISNVIGPGDTSINFLPSILAEAQRTGTVSLHTSPRSSKDYIDVDDVCAVLERIALHGKHRIYNVASGINTTNEAITNLIASGMGVNATFIADSPTIIFPQIDISRIRSEFAFTATPFDVSFEKLMATSLREARLQDDYHHR